MAEAAPSPDWFPDDLRTGGPFLIREIEQYLSLPSYAHEHYDFPPPPQPPEPSKELGKAALVFWATPEKIIRSFGPLAALSGVPWPIWPKSGHQGVDGSNATDRH